MSDLSEEEEREVISEVEIVEEVEELPSEERNEYEGDDDDADSGGDLDEEDGHDHVALTDHVSLTYPKLTLRLSLKSTRSMHCYLKVKKFVIGAWYDLGDAGMTESLPVSIGSTVRFDTPIEVQYHVAIDDYQRLWFGIYDGDFLNTKGGYYFASIEMQMRELLFGQNNVFQVFRDEDYLCELTVDVEVTYDAEERVTLPTGQVPEGLTPEQASAESLKVAFYKSEPPTLISLRVATPHFWELFGTYVFAFEALGLLSSNSIDLGKIIDDATTVRLRLCLGDTKEPDHSNRLEALWTSMPVLKVYDVQVLEVKISHEDLTGERDVKKNGAADARIVMQVIVKNIGDPSFIDRSDQVISTLSIPLIEVIELAKKTTGATKKSSELRKCIRKWDFVQAKNLCKMADPNKKQAKRDGGLFGFLSNKGGQSGINKGKDGEITEKGGSRDSFDEIIDEISGSHAQTEDSATTMTNGNTSSIDPRSARATYSGEANAINSNGENAKKEQHRWGQLILRVKREDIQVKCEAGDAVYEEKLKLKLVRELREWTENNRRPFKMACKQQQKRIDRAKCELELLMKGGTVIPSLVLDLHSLCIQQMQFLLKRHKNDLTLSKAQSTYHGSAVVDAAQAVYKALTLFNREGSVVALAGGVVPPKERYPSRGQCRQLALPLCQEYVLSQLGPEYEEMHRSVDCHHMQVCAGSPSHVPTNAERVADIEMWLEMIDPHNDLLGCLEPKLPMKPYGIKDVDAWSRIDEHKRYFAWEEIESSKWGGPDYVKSVRYSGGSQLVKALLESTENLVLADFKQGILEAASLYQPCLNRCLAVNEDDVTDMVQIERRKTTQTIMLSANVGTVVNNEELSEELWHNWLEAEAEKPDRKKTDPSPLQLLCDGRELESVSKVSVDAVRRLLDSAKAEVATSNANVGTNGSLGKTKGTVVWIMGTDQGMDTNNITHRSAYDGLFDIFTDHVDNNPEVALIVVLAPETRVDLLETAFPSVHKTAAPFGAFLTLFDTWRDKQLGPSFRGSRTNVSKSPTLMRVAARNLVVIQWPSFAEILAQNYKEQPQKFALPKKSEMKQVLMKYMDEINADRVVAIKGDDDSGGAKIGGNELDEEEMRRRGATIATGFFARFRGGAKGAPGSGLATEIGSTAPSKRAERDTDLIEGYNELKEIKHRFEVERQPLFLAELKLFLSDFVCDGTKKTSIEDKRCDCSIS